MKRPAVRTVAGIKLVTISLAEYVRLLDCRRRLAELKLVRRAFEHPYASPIERDPEVAVFIAERLGRLNLRAIREACTRQFGPARTPSRSAIHRYSARASRDPS